MTDLKTIKWCETHGSVLFTASLCEKYAMIYKVGDQLNCRFVDRVILPADRDEMMRALGFGQEREVRGDAEGRFSVMRRWVSDWEPVK